MASLERTDGLSHPLADLAPAPDRPRAEMGGASWRAVLDQLVEGVVVIDARGRITFANEAAERLHGRSMVGTGPDAYTSTFDLRTEDGRPYPPEDLPVVRALRSGQTIAEARWRIRRPDGTEIVAIGSARPIPGEGGRPAGAVLTLRDDTARLAAEERLRTSEARYRSLFEQAAAGIARVGLDGRFLEVNDRLCAIAGYAREELLARGFQAITHPDDLAADLANAEALIAGRIRQYTMEKRYRAKDGGEVWVHLSVGLVRRGDGAPDHFVAMVEDITARKGAEERLRRNHDTFYQLIQNNPFGIYVVDADFKLRQISRGSRKVFENVRPLIGRDFGEVLRTIWPEPFASEAIGRFRHTLVTGEPYVSTSTIEQRQDTEEVESYDWRIERIVLPDGRYGVVCYFYDLSERLALEAALRETEERYRLAVRATNDAIWDWDLATNHVRWNEAVSTLFGYPPEAVGSSSAWWKDRIHPEDRARVVGSIHAVTDGTAAHWSAEYRFRCRDGGYAHVLDRGYVLRDSTGRAVRMIGAMLDLTARKAAEAALAAKAEEFQTLADNISQLAWMTDETGAIYWYNRRWFDFTGTTLEEMQGWGWRKVHHPDHVEGVVERLRHCFETGEPWEDTFPLRGKDGAYRWFLSRALPIRDAEGRIVRWFGTNTDVTGQRAIERELAEALAAREALLYEVNHRVTNSLQLVVSLLTLQGRGVRDPDARRALEEAQARIGVIARIHRQLYQGGTHGTLDFGEHARRLAADLLASLEGSGRIGLAFSSEGGAVLPLERAVPLSLILAELVTNAVKYAFPDGRAGTVELAVMAEGGELALLVADDGVGLPAGFDPAASGGLGMTLVAGLAQQVQGRLEIVPRDRGAGFRVTLPER
jgi:PAS domain S-box-containing protein